MKARVNNVLISVILLCSCLAIERSSNTENYAKNLHIPDSLAVFQVTFEFWNDSIISSSYYERYDPFLVAAAWKYDSTACLKMRNAEMSDYLVEKFNIRRLELENVLLYLGPPNQIYKGRFYDLEEHESVDHYFYFYDQSCKDGKPREGLHGCWLDITIDTLSNKVVAINWPCI